MSSIIHILYFYSAEALSKMQNVAVDPKGTSEFIVNFLVVQ